jgi:hypothetical protein
MKMVRNSGRTNYVSPKDGKKEDKLHFFGKSIQTSLYVFMG